MAKTDDGTLGARLIRENQTLKAREGKYRKRVVRLENAIRKHTTGDCECESWQECLMRLYRLVPADKRK